MVGLTKELVWEVIDNTDAGFIADEIADDDGKDSWDYMEYLRVRLEEMEAFHLILDDAFWAAPQLDSDGRYVLNELKNRVATQIRGVQRVLGHLLFDAASDLLDAAAEQAELDSVMF